MDRFHETNIDGETIILMVEPHRITIGNRFEYNVRILTNRTPEINRGRTQQAFDFFRNVAPLIHRSELKEGWKNYAT
jgi:hypothetical protein